MSHLQTSRLRPNRSRLHATSKGIGSFEPLQIRHALHLRASSGAIVADTERIGYKQGLLNTTADITFAGQTSMGVDFKKYHGLGNDYLVIDPNVRDVAMTEDNIRLICHRNFGVGSDGILYGPTFEGDMPVLRILNPDGSEAEKSGNGLRIFAKYLFEKQYVQSRTFKIKTLGGIVHVQVKDDVAGLIRINMGKVTFLSNEIPVAGEPREVVNEPLDINGVELKVTCLSIGNPHCVIPMETVDDERVRALGPFVENHKKFPNRINLQIVRVVDRANIDIRIWERGAGYTLASGSSSCAAACAVHKLGLVDNDITVHMPGGQLHIEIAEDGEVFMTGPVEGAFEGIFHGDLEVRLGLHT